MSYFCANQIKLNKPQKTFQVKGGDNNLVPRFNEWTNPIPISALLSEISGRSIQFKTRSEKHLTIEALVKEYDETFIEEFKLSAYDLSDLITNDDLHLDTTLERVQKELQSNIDDLPNYSGNYGQEKVEISQRRLDLLKDFTKYNNLLYYIAQFESEIINLKISKADYVIKNRNSFYATKVTKRRLFQTPIISEAKRYGKLQAEELSEPFPNAEPEKIK
jgi:hypothetical protein